MTDQVHSEFRYNKELEVHTYDPNTKEYRASYTSNPPPKTEQQSTQHRLEHIEAFTKSWVALEDGYKKREKEQDAEIAKLKSTLLEQGQDLDSAKEQIHAIAAQVKSLERELHEKEKGLAEERGRCTALRTELDETMTKFHKMLDGNERWNKMHYYAVNELTAVKSGLETEKDKHHAAKKTPSTTKE
jgi:chromosome segregation ATPase